MNEYKRYEMGKCFDWLRRGNLLSILRDVAGQDGEKFVSWAKKYVKGIGIGQKGGNIKVL